MQTQVAGNVEERTQARVEPFFVHVIAGRERILGFRRILIPFSEQCEQPGTMEDLPYFLSKPGLLRRKPVLYLLVHRDGLTDGEIEVGDLCGVALLYEYEFSWLRTGIYSTNDRSGRGTLIAPRSERSRIALEVSRMILKRGAHTVLLSFQGDGAETKMMISAGDGGGSGLAGMVQAGMRVGRVQAAVRTRSQGAFLPLMASYDETLATLGQKTRSNMRYYRRRAETHLGCRFVAEVAISEAELLRFNAETMFAVPNRDALWRLRTQGDLASPLLMGLQDRDGRWLSILAGRRHQHSTEILWQMNRKGLPSQSLSTVMRSYCMEHEIGRGAQRLYVEGGTGHSINHAFEAETLIDLAMVKSSMMLWTIRKLSNRLVTPDNLLASMLNSSETEWYRC